jgi:hypothetical protein
VFLIFRNHKLNNNKDTFSAAFTHADHQFDELENLKPFEIRSQRNVKPKSNAKKPSVIGITKTMPQTALLAGKINTAQFLNDTMAVEKISF